MNSRIPSATPDGAGVIDFELVPVDAARAAYDEMPPGASSVIKAEPDHWAQWRRRPGPLDRSLGDSTIDWLLALPQPLRPHRLAEGYPRVANLIAGAAYEPHEENPMIGFRGASRYIHPDFRECFALECRAVRKVREEMGLTNLWVMIPFVRTLEEGRAVIEVLEANGLKQGSRHGDPEGLKVIMMCEVPSNALLADEFLEIFDGFSIGSNDLTQLTLGLDRDSGIVASLFDERNPAVKKMLSMAIAAARAKGKYVGICGQGPSDHPDLAEWLMDQGIESVSLNPDTVVDTWLRLAQHKGR